MNKQTPPKKTINDLRDQLKHMSEAKTEALQAVVQCDIDLEEARDSLADAITAGGDTKALCKKIVHLEQEKAEAQAAAKSILAVLEDREPAIRRALANALIDARIPGLEECQAQVTKELKELAKELEAAYNRACGILRFQERFGEKTFKDHGKAEQLDYMGLPVVVLRDKIQFWLSVFEGGE